MHGSYKVAFDSVWGFKSIDIRAEGCDQNGAGIRFLGEKGEHGGKMTQHFRSFLLPHHRFD